MLKKVLVLVLTVQLLLEVCSGLALPLSGASEAAGRSLYDQRQEGDLNVRVDLDNFVLLVARPVSSLDLFGAMAGLAAAADAKHQSSDIQAAHSPAANEQQHHPQQQSHEDDQLNKEEPRADRAAAVVASAATRKETAKGLEEVVRTLRNMKEKELRDRKESEERSSALDAKYKLLESVAEPQNLKLVGDAVENCGPGRHRDSKASNDNERYIYTCIQQVLELGLCLHARGPRERSYIDSIPTSDDAKEKRARASAVPRNLHAQGKKDRNTEREREREKRRRGYKVQERSLTTYAHSYVLIYLRGLGSYTERPGPSSETDLYVPRPSTSWDTITGRGLLALRQLIEYPSRPAANTAILFLFLALTLVASRTSATPILFPTESNLARDPPLPISPIANEAPAAAAPAATITAAPLIEQDKSNDRDIDRYDQRQNGTENYRVNVDGLVFILAPAETLLMGAALGPDFSSMFTEKPSKPDSNDALTIKPKDHEKVEVVPKYDISPDSSVPAAQHTSSSDSISKS
ncbi:unnamed protein product [Trichogramma brassicae]|uniref:Uncharacterized protein n=1 Tax=Trichogramma brassicae TaxID=86971 RepID=A0A6H5IH23_9HYME|nr:unnamed protein product [Trichogramma brassicae]